MSDIEDELIKQLQVAVLEVSNLLALLAHERKRKQAVAVTDETHSRTGEQWTINQRVRILNIPKSLTTDDTDREARIRWIKEDKIGITTANGRKTWRAPHNLAAL